jgi:hypothetical protein
MANPSQNIADLLSMPDEVLLQIPQHLSLLMGGNARQPGQYFIKLTHVLNQEHHQSICSLSQDYKIL